MTAMRPKLTKELNQKLTEAVESGSDLKEFARMILDRPRQSDT